MKRGFTVLELLVASLLLAMLVTMLSMMFNQSSIAWRTGVAGVVELDTVREEMSAYHDFEDDVLPGLGQSQVAINGNSDGREIRYRNVSIFKNGQLRNNTDRAFKKVEKDYGYVQVDRNILIGKAQDLGNSDSSVRSRQAYVIGVRSAGPDRKMETEGDNITNWPEEVD